MRRCDLKVTGSCSAVFIGYWLSEGREIAPTVVGRVFDRKVVLSKRPCWMGKEKRPIPGGLAA